MPRKQAGWRYPHATTAARKHECVMCPVVGLVAERALDGAEPWGIPHRMPPLDGGEQQAEQVRDQLFNGRNCPKLRRAYGPLSVSVTFLTGDEQLVNRPAVRRPEGYVLVVRVWSRAAAKAEIARRVESGEQLHYNVLKGTA